MTKIVTAAIIRNDQGILLTRRAPGERHAGFWEFPGGKVEVGESFADCLKRELLEELGVRSEVGGILCSSEFNYDYGSIKLIALEARLAPGDFRLTSHDRIEWVEPSRLLQYQLLPADIPIAEFIMSRG